MGGGIGDLDLAGVAEAGKLAAETRLKRFFQAENPQTARTGGVQEIPGNRAIHYGAAVCGSEYLKRPAVVRAGGWLHGVSPVG